MYHGYSQTYQLFSRRSLHSFNPMPTILCLRLPFSAYTIASLHSPFPPFRTPPAFYTPAQGKSTAGVTQLRRMVGETSAMEAANVQKRRLCVVNSEHVHIIDPGE